MKNLFKENQPLFILGLVQAIGHFTVMDGNEAEGDLVLIQTFALLWKLFLKNNSQHKNNLIYIIKQKGLYQNKVTLSLASIHNCKIAYSSLKLSNSTVKVSGYVTTHSSPKSQFALNEKQVLKIFWTEIKSTIVIYHANYFFCPVLTLKVSSN